MIHSIDVILICASFDNSAFFVYLPAGVYIGVASFLHISSSSTLLALLHCCASSFPSRFDSSKPFQLLRDDFHRFFELELPFSQQSSLNAIVTDSTDESTPKRVFQYFLDYMRAFSKTKA